MLEYTSISSSDEKNIIKTIRRKKEGWSQGRDKEIQEKKIKEMEQDEEVICTINKGSNQSNQFLATQKKEFFSVTDEHGNLFFAEEEKR